MCCLFHVDFMWLLWMLETLGSLRNIGCYFIWASCRELLYEIRKSSEISKHFSFILSVQFFVCVNIWTLFCLTICNKRLLTNKAERLYIILSFLYVFQSVNLIIANELVQAMIVFSNRLEFINFIDLILKMLNIIKFNKIIYYQSFQEKP